MSNMFTNYENLDSTYVPNNRNKEIQKQCILNYEIPKEIYDNNKQIIGYSWSYGDTFTIRYNANRPIYVEKDAILYYGNEEPDEDTVGRKGQKVYNLSYSRCWICESLDSSIYNWVEQKNFTFPANGEEKVYVQPPYDLTKMTAKVVIENFRHEEIYSKEYELSDGSITIDIDKELSEKLVKGIYYMYVILFDNISFEKVDRKLTLTVQDYSNDVVGEY